MSEMGKAMMGTGEASGERRAIQAAEAAISNPLLDEVSMSGARGLLISITGGNDLGLYEVDEAASRIRQEVDEDANIILGATFDQSLDGVVRVSVVATGIDRDQIEAAEPATSQQRIAEAAQRLRAQASARAQAAAQPAASPAYAPAPIPAPAPTAETAVEPAPVMAPIAPAPVAAAVAEVELHPVAPRPALYAEPMAQPTLFEEPVSEFVPPQPEQIVRPARMPQIQDLPPIAQQQMRIHRGEQPPHGESRRKSLLEKLAAFGISRNEEPPPAPRAAPILPAPPARTQPPVQSHADYGRPQPRTLAPRAAQGALDPHGRVGPKPIEEDQLEIPAFLRRQSS
jgi:cell division protein FtsZ